MEEANIFKLRHFKLSATMGHCERTPRVQKGSRSIKAFIQPPAKGLRILSSGDSRVVRDDLVDKWVRLVLDCYALSDRQTAKDLMPCWLSFNKIQWHPVNRLCLNPIQVF